MAIQLFLMKVGVEGSLSNKALKVDGYCDLCDEVISHLFLKDLWLKNPDRLVAAGSSLV